MSRWPQHLVVVATLGLAACDREPADPRGAAPSARDIRPAAGSSRSPSAPHVGEGGTLALAANDARISATFAGSCPRLWLAGFGHARVCWRSIGRPSRPSPVGDARIDVAGEKVVLTFDGIGSEWWKTAPDGLEQGFTLENPPPGSGELVLSLEMPGFFPVEEADDPSSVRWVDAEQRTAVRYTKLSVVDALERPLASRMRARGGLLDLVIDDDGARYPIVVDPTWTLQATLTNWSSSWTPESVAVSGDTIALGNSQAWGIAAPFGAVRLFERAGHAWTETTTLVGTSAYRTFGLSVDLDGDTLVVGAPHYSMGPSPPPGPGSVRVYEREGDAWTLQGHLQASDASTNDHFGIHVALSGDDLVVGTDKHAAYVFSRQGATWSQQQKLIASGVSPFPVGSNLCVRDGVIVLMSYTVEPAYVFERFGGTWIETAVLGLPYGIVPNCAITESEILLKENTEFISVFDKSAGSWQQVSTLGPMNAYSFAAAGTLMIIPPFYNFPGEARRRTASGWTLESEFATPGAAWPNAEEPLDTDGVTAVLVTGQFTNVVAMLEPLGEPCSSPTSCESGFCADGVCCDSPYLSSCQACSPAGACEMHASGTDPEGECASGVCNGSGACIAELGAPCASGAECASGLCVGGVCCNEHCAGSCESCSIAGSMGSCSLLPAGHPGEPSCAPYACNGQVSGCASSCATSSECQEGFWCDGQQCNALLSVGSPCTDTPQCSSGFCSDGVCCDLACGGSTPEDCQACAVSAGAEQDGACTLLSMGTVCRVGQGQCDAPEQCNGADPACPADVVHPAATLCRRAADGCDLPEYCDGSSSSCGDDVLAPDGTACDVGSCIAGLCTPSTGSGGGTTSITTGTGAGGAGGDGGVATGGAASGGANAPFRPLGDPSCGCRTIGLRGDAELGWPAKLGLLGLSLLALGVRRRRRVA